MTGVICVKRTEHYFYVRNKNSPLLFISYHKLSYYRTNIYYIARRYACNDLVILIIIVCNHISTLISRARIGLCMAVYAPLELEGAKLPLCKVPV